MKLGNIRLLGILEGKGLLVGIELVNDKETKEPIDNDKIASVVNACKERAYYRTKRYDDSRI